MQLERLREFDLTRLPSRRRGGLPVPGAWPGSNPADERLVAMGQVRDLTPLRDDDGRLVALPAAEDALDRVPGRDPPVQAQRRPKKRFDTNRIMIYVWPPSELTPDELNDAGPARAADHGGRRAWRRCCSSAGSATRHRRADRDRRADLLRRRATARGCPSAQPSTEPIEPLDDYRQKVLRAARPRHRLPVRADRHARRAGGTFTEHDLDEHRRAGAGGPARRGATPRRIVAGVVTHADRRGTREGVTRVVLLGDPTKALGALSEPECARVIAALDLAERMRVPLEWFALSAGARISMASGTENMDWVAAALKRIVEFTQDGGEINIVVAGINVGAQPYWNAEATMLMHTKGILVMTPDSAMVLTGKQSLDFSGGVSAEDNFGIGGYDRVMGPNGQAQYWAPDLPAARDVLMAHYDHTYVAPGETGPRRAATTDPVDRDVSGFPHAVAGQRLHHRRARSSPPRHNPDRKKPFDIRTVMRALSDQDHPVLERWAGMADAETAVVQDVHLGGIPVCLLGHRVPVGAAARLPAHRRPGHLHRGHAVPAVVEEGRAGDQRGQRQPAAGRAGEPVRVRRLAGVDAQAAAGVRRGDRPGDRELPRARSCSA